MEIKIYELKTLGRFLEKKLLGGYKKLRERIFLMNAVLLGGSNSVMTFGLRSGLRVNEKVNLIELAVGATSSLQNLYALIKNSRLIKTANLIITESNVNDSYNISNIDISLEAAFDNIDRFYQELSFVQCSVCVILIPINFDKVTPASADIAEKINFYHLQTIKRFGFDFIDLTQYIKKHLELTNSPKGMDREEAFNYMVPDPKHPKIDFMHDLGKNIISYYNKKSLKLANYEQTGNYFALLADSIDSNIEKKSNSRFVCNLLKINKRYYFPKEYYSYTILGMGTWGQGCVKINTKKMQIVKCFNPFYSFNEILQELIISYDTYFENTSEKPTEKSVNVHLKNHEFCELYIEGFLLTKVKKINTDKFYNNENISTNLEFIVPELSRYLADSKQAFESFKKYFLDFEKVNIIRDIAILLEEKDIHSAYELMKIVQHIRPTGPGICKKVEKYEKMIRTKTKKL